MLSYGIDISHYQSPTAPGGVPWTVLRSQGCEFAIVRACYGTSRDASAPAHVHAARTVGMQVGLYAFFRSSQPVTAQLAVFCAQALACGIKVGDIVPALDIEDDGNTGPKVDPAWSEAAQSYADGLVAAFGECLIYITQRDHGRMGKPAWVLERPLWCAHYTGAPKPATPGNKSCVIWQHRVAPYQYDGPGGAFQPMVLDQNRALAPIPTCTRVPGATASAPAPADGPAPDHDHDELTAARTRNDAAWDSLTMKLYQGLDLTHRADDEPTDPAIDPTALA